ncbi:thioredoxin 2 [Botrimarina colliarenosi]|uniref:Thioredoxin 2 n=1 Tax=Botrimarina colliarenosi TaxID=2528001 RepID=A0A5C6A9L5_9BACT|nr:thioredoxin family protein [Botrimarina colliarenosi]TWT96136.1 thioredoxin 2 [Botrimarina colliarenosi]
MRALVCNSVALWLVALGVTSTLAQSEGMPWRSDYQAARAEAQQTGKLLLVHFWTESCGPCKLLDARVFNQPQVGMAVSNEFVPVKVNANEAQQLAQAYGVTRVPTDVVVTPQGQVVQSFVSPATPMEYISATTQVAAYYHTQSGQAYAAATAGAPDSGSAFQSNATTTPTNAGPGDSQANPAYASFNRPAAAAPATTMASNPYASQPTTATPPTTAAQQAAAPQANQYAAAPQQPVAPAPVAQQPRQQVEPVMAKTTPALPQGSPALGFDGYCPVTMKNEWRWAKGDVRWGAIHEGRTYLFASQEAQQAFLSKPDAYSPVLAGSDPVAAVDQRQSVPGVREFAVEFEGRFYMFSNEQTLEKFWSNPTAYAQGAQRVASLPADAAFIR